MKRFLEYLEMRWRWASKGIVGLCGLASLAAGAAIAIALWMFPAWAHRHINEQTNAFIIGLVPLFVGGGVFLVRWILSPYFIWVSEGEKARQLKKDLAFLHEKRADFIYQGHGSSVKLSFRIKPETNRPIAR